jgi:hypothetical protein
LRMLLTHNQLTNQVMMILTVISTCEDVVRIINIIFKS